MRVLHDGPLHYTSVDVLATDLSYLAISHHRRATGVQQSITFASLFVSVESENRITANENLV